MNKIVRQMVIFLAITLPSIVWAEQITQDSLNKLMDLSGIHKQAIDFPKVVQAGLIQAKKQGTPMSDTAFNKIQRAMTDAFQADELLKIIGAEVQNSITESQAKELLIWYESEVGKLIIKAEEDAATPMAYQQMIEEKQMLMADQDWVKIAKMMDDLTHTTDITMQLQQGTNVAIFTAVSVARHPDKPVQIAAFREQLITKEQALRPDVEQFVILSFIYSYKDVKATNIERYFDFLKQENTKKFNASIRRGVKDAFEQANNKMAQSLVVEFKESAENSSH